MHPIICKIGPFTIYSYGLMVAIAFLVSLRLINLQASKQGLDAGAISNFSFLVFVSGVIGCRLFYVLEHFRYYIRNPVEIIMFQHGGMSWFGGLFLGTICGVIYLRRKGMLSYRVLDLIVPFVALAQAIGRVGCLLNGCCFGKASKFGLYFPVHDAVLIPTQLYSSLALLSIFIILRIVQQRSHREGEIFYLYLLLYSLKRFMIEFWRADNNVLILGLTLFQLISLVIFCLAFTKIFLLNRPNFK